MISSTADADQKHPIWGTRRLWSLWDMINFNLAAFCTALDLLRMDITVCSISAKRKDGPPVVPDSQKAQIKNHFEYISRQCAELLLDKADGRIARISPLFDRHCSWAELAAELHVLEEAIEDDIKMERFYHYRRDKGLLVLQTRGDWSPTVAAFREAVPEIDAAVDCYGMEQNTACVFHSMRILEHGLRAMAAAVNLTFDIQQWQTIIEQIESEIRWLGNNWRASSAKTEWMGFYSAAAKEFMYFKDGWRNHVMHGRITYDQHQALSSLEHVRTFMNHLSSRLSE